jgi:uncharacterized protein (DUF2164 family)
VRRLALVVLVACGTREVPERGPGSDGEPPRVPATPPVTTTDWNREEWKLLREVARHGGAGLPALASHYQQLGAWDAYAQVRARMLELAPARPGPAPGGPFPRIGAPRDTPPPNTVLGRWLNATDLPELYEKLEVSPRELERRLRAEEEPKSATTLRRLGDLACAQLQFDAGAAYYRQAIVAGDRRARERLADVTRVLHGPP